MDILKIKGEANFKVYDKAGGTLIQDVTCTNIITTVGKGIASGLIFNVGGYTAFNYIAVGTSSTAVTGADTALGAEIVDSGLQRATPDSATQTTTTSTNDSVTLVKVFTASGSKTVAEAGIFNAVSGPTILSHMLVSPNVILISGNVLSVTYKVTLA